MKITSIILSSMLILCVSLNTAAGGDWLKWRGPYGTGISNETNWNSEALKKEVKIIWDAKVGKGHSAAVIQGDYVYTMGNKMVASGGDTTLVDVVCCLKVENGKQVWSYSYPCEQGLDPGPGSTPVIDGSSLYTLSREGHLTCFNAKNGIVNWQRNIVSDSLTKRHEWGFSSSPVIVENLLLLNINKSGIALNKNSGQLVWNSEAEESWYATPVLFNYNGKETAAISTQRSVVACDVQTGNVLWTYRWEGRCSDPIPFDNKMLLTGTGSELLEITDTEPKSLWKNRRVNGSFQSWVVVDGYAYGFGQDRRQEPIQCIDMKNGEVKWSKNLCFAGSLIAANDKLIIVSRDGNLIIAKACPDSYKEISSASIVPMADNTGVHNRRQCHCWINPVLANGRIYLRNTYGNLVCVDISQ